MVFAHMQKAGHRGVKVTWHRLEAYCAWAGMEADVAEFVTHCPHCVDSCSSNMVP